MWAVESGADASSNSAGNILTLGEGLKSLDLYFDTDGDISWGWDITLSVAGTGFISSLAGGDINGSIGTPTADGFQQLGGDFSVDLNGGPLLLFSFVYDSLEGALLSIASGSNYTSGTSFETETIAPVTLVQTTAVPLPAASWLMFSGLLALVSASKLSRKRS